VISIYYDDLNATEVAYEMIYEVITEVL